MESPHRVASVSAKTEALQQIVVDRLVPIGACPDVHGDRGVVAVENVDCDSVGRCCPGKLGGAGRSSEAELPPGVDGWLEHREQFGLGKLEGAAGSTRFVSEAAQSDGVATRTDADDVVENRIGHDLYREGRLGAERKTVAASRR